MRGYAFAWVLAAALGAVAVAVDSMVLAVLFAVVVGALVPLTAWRFA